MVLKNLSPAKEEIIKSNADAFIREGTTIRDVARKIGVAKSTLHSRLTWYLPDIDYERYVKVRDIINKNLSERHLRGGSVTKSKYTGIPAKDRKKSK